MTGSKISDVLDKRQKSGMTGRDSRIDVVGIGNAIVDILCHVEEDFLEINGVEKGIMQLIDMGRAVHLYDLMTSAEETCGGSVANTIAGIALLGGNPAFIGKVKDDHLGHVFATDAHSIGMEYRTTLAHANSEFQTGRSMILITPDGERSMNTYLGAAESLTPDDIDGDLISRSEWIFLEGYLLDGAESQETFREAIKYCHRSGGKVSLTLSDPYCVERHRAAFRELVEQGVELVLCNKDELLSYYLTGSIEEALEQAASEFGIVACTMSEKGAVIAAGDDTHWIDACETQLVDATGAGDFFAAGVLRGLSSGEDLATSGRMGCLAASEVISQVGARPRTNLLQLFRQHGLGDDQPVAAANGGLQH